MPSRPVGAVSPLVPLMLLEAVRDADRPEGAAEAEYVPELLNKRLGTTDTIHAQIRRYADAMRRSQPVAVLEVTGLARLIARRPDAPAVFRAAGEASGRAVYERVSASRRALLRVLPRMAARPLARRTARTLVAHYFGATLERDGTGLRLMLPPTAGDDLGDGRAFYDTGVQALLTLLALT